MEYIKKYIKKFLGENISDKISILKKYIKYVYKKIFAKSININKDKVTDAKCFKLKNKNVFCGYYDLQPIKNKKMLVHVANKKANTKTDKIEIGYFDIDNNQYKKITDTMAWSWQQGSRLRWSNKEDDIIYFNDIDQNTYCCKKYDLKNNKLVKKIPFALYDIDADEKYGISLNFSRLQRLRPGYGYNFFDDNTIDEKAPKDDGMFLVDLENNTKKLLISLHDLADLVDKERKYEHYINHISISPNGEKIMFFHLWTDNTYFNWRNQLCIIDIDGKNLKILENEDLVSHYHWKNDDELLITGVTYANKEEFYRYYNVNTKKKENIEDKNLKRDGHPIHEKTLKKFYSDTYPDSNFMQKLFEYNIEKEEYNELIEVFSKIAINAEKRCDLHPKLINDENIILIDTTYSKGIRSVLLVKLRESE